LRHRWPQAVAGQRLEPFAVVHVQMPAGLQREALASGLGLIIG
jgi:hypothetical protein